jgi:hypothetical protein
MIKDSCGSTNLWEILSKGKEEEYYLVKSRETHGIIYKENVEIREGTKFLFSKDYVLNVGDYLIDIDPGENFLTLVDYVRKGIKTGNRLIDELDYDEFMFI